MAIEKQIEPVLLDEMYKKERAMVFFIEDNKELVSLVQKTMYDEFNFYFAFNGAEALQKIKQIYKPDIIISDIMMSRQCIKSPAFPLAEACAQEFEHMPEKEVKDTMDGHEFHNNIIRDENFNDIPFLFLTARSVLHEKIESLAKGAVDYIYKPFDMQELLEKVRSLMKTRKAHIEQMKKKLAHVLDTEEDQKALGFERFCEKYRISRKEREIIKGLLMGLQNKEIAADQHLSKNTVSKHVRSIYQKCRVQNRIELVNRINETA